MDVPAGAAVATELGVHGLLPYDRELMEGELGHRLTLELIEELDDRARALLVHQLLRLALLLGLGGADASPPAICGWWWGGGDDGERERLRGGSGVGRRERRGGAAVADGMRLGWDSRGRVQGCEKKKKGSADICDWQAPI